MSILYSKVRSGASSEAENRLTEVKKNGGRKRSFRDDSHLGVCQHAPGSRSRPYRGSADLPLASQPETQDNRPGHGKQSLKRKPQNLIPVHDCLQFCWGWDRDLGILLVDHIAGVRGLYFGETESPT